MFLGPFLYCDPISILPHNNVHATIVAKKFGEIVIEKWTGLHLPMSLCSSILTCTWRSILFFLRRDWNFLATFYQWRWIKDTEFTSLDHISVDAYITMKSFRKWKRDIVGFRAATSNYSRIIRLSFWGNTLVVLELCGHQFLSFIIWLWRFDG